MRELATDVEMGIVNLGELAEAKGSRERGDWMPVCSGRGLQPGDRTPGREAGLQQPVVLGGWEEVAAGAEVVGDRAEGSEERLRVRRRFEALEHALSSTRRLARVLRPIIEPLVPPVLGPREHVPRGSSRGAGSTTRRRG
jgi:hypothetical protein